MRKVNVPAPLKWNVPWSSFLLCSLLAFGVACKITLISPYDEEIDKSATALQKEMDAFLTKLQAAPDAPEASYAQNKKFYDDYAVALRSVQVRAHSHPKNTLTEQQLELMMKSLEETRATHASGPLSPAFLEQTRNLFNQAWGAIIKLEVSKKRQGSE